MLTQAFVKTVQVYRREGFMGIGVRLACLIRKRPENRPDAFDVTHGIDTCRQVYLWKLNIPSPDWLAGVKYQPVSVTDFDDAIAHLPIDPSQYTFIDLGSGKGRALILAFKNGFRRVVGVEFSAELCAVARRNLAATGVNAEVVYQSASDYLFPDEPTVIFLYNPFRPAVLVPVLKRLHPGTWIIYVNPEYASAVDSLNFRLAYRTDDNAICTDGISIWQAR